MMTNPLPLTTKWSDESIVDLIRRLRNDLIKDFLDERFLKEYVALHYNVKDLSQTKIEFIKNALKELLIRPVDRSYYRVIIENIRETDSASLSEGNELLFFKEIESVLKQYIFL